MSLSQKVGQGRLWPFVMALIALWATSYAMAATLEVSVRNIAGGPVKDAVVTFTPAGGVTLTTEDRKGPFVMAQKGLQFAPYLLIVPVGATVSFPNLDRVNHHVYSFSPTKMFQMPLYGYHQSRNQVFDKPGTVALGCNIHDQMTAYIRVVTTPYYARTDDKGNASLTDLPQTSGSVSVWHPMIAGAEVSQTLTPAAAAQSLAFTLKLRTP